MATLPIDYTKYCESDQRILGEVEMVKALLDYCCIRHGATITLCVEHDDGHKAVARLYDHAALVQSLFDALTEFQEEY